MTVATIDPGAGRVTATRRQLVALVDWARASAAPGGTVADELTEAALTEAGLVADGAVRPALVPVVAVLSGPHGRVVVRRWRGATIPPVVEVLAGPAGVLVLPGGPDLDAVQDLRWHPRPTALPRVVAEELDATIHDGPAPVGPGPTTWAELVAAAEDPDGALSLADVRWSPDAGTALASVLVVVWSATGGLAEVLPMAGRPSVLTTRGRHPIEIWSGLTRLGVPR